MNKKTENNDRIATEFGQDVFGGDWNDITIDGVNIGHPAKIPWDNTGWWRRQSKEALDALRDGAIQRNMVINKGEIMSKTDITDREWWFRVGELIGASEIYGWSYRNSCEYRKPHKLELTGNVACVLMAQHEEIKRLQQGFVDLVAENTPQPKLLRKFFRKYRKRWVPVMEALPPERAKVLVLIRGDNFPAFGYLKFAAGDRTCPYFVCPQLAAMEPRNVALSVPVNAAGSQEITHWLAIDYVQAPKDRFDVQWGLDKGWVDHQSQG